MNPSAHLDPVQMDSTLEKVVGLARRALKLPWLWVCGPAGEVLAGARPLEWLPGGPESGAVYPLEHREWGKLGELGWLGDSRPVSDVLEGEILELCTLLTDVLAQQQAGLWSVGTLEHSPQPAFATDLEGRIRRFNQAALTLFRLGTGEVQGQLFEHIPALSSPRLDVAFSEACAGAEVRSLELPCFRSDGTVALLRFSLAPLLDASKRLRGVVFCADDLLASLEDSSERETLRRLYAEVLDHLPLELTLVDAEERVIYLNPYLVPDARTRRSFQGMRREEVSRLLGRSESVLEGRRARYAEVRRTLARTQWEETLPTPQGLRYLTRSIQPMLSHSGQLEMFIAYSFDVTEQRRAQFEREEALALFQGLFEHATEGIYRLDAQNRLLWANPALLRFNRCSSEAQLREMLGDNPGNWYVEPGRDAEFMRLLEIEAGVVGFESEVQLEKSEERRWISESARAVRDASGRTLYTEGTIQDITARKVAELEREQALQLYQNLFENATEGIYQSTPEGRMLRANPALVKFNGYASEAELLQVVQDIAMEWYVQPGRRDEFIRQLETQERLALFESEVYCHKTRERVWISESARMVRDEQGKPLYFEGTVQDITARKVAEVQLEREKRLLEQVFETSPNPIFVRDTQGQLVLVNTMMHQTNGPDTHDFWTGIGPRHPHNVAEFAQWLENDRTMLTRGEAMSFEETFTRLDGEVLVYSTVKAPLHREDGSVQVLGICTDITALKRNTERLTFIEQAVEASSDSISISNVRGEVIYLNSAARRNFGFSLEQLRQRSEQGQGLIPPEIIPRVRQAFDRREPFQGETTVLGARGDEIPVLMRLDQMRDAQGVEIGVVSVVTDISERRRIERLKDEFVATVSHELRTPLTSISGALGLLTAGVLGEVGPEQRPMLDIAHKNAERLITLVGDLLDMQKMEGEGLSLSFEPLELRAVLEQALAEIAPYAGRLGVSLTLELGGEPGRVRGDFGRLAQVVSNLLSNACKFSSAGGSVTVRVFERESRVRLEVEDRGVGIPEAFWGQIFGKFAQADASSTRSKGGTGLGLAISKAIVERHGGTIGFEPLEVGTRFYFELPRSPLER